MPDRTVTPLRLCAVSGYTDTAAINDILNEDGRLLTDTDRGRLVADDTIEGIDPPELRGREVSDREAQEPESAEAAAPATEVRPPDCGRTMVGSRWMSAPKSTRTSNHSLASRFALTRF